MKPCFLKYIIIFLFCSAAVNGIAQSRMPEVKIAPRQPEKTAKDSLDFEERPYFLLIEQSEKALEEGNYDAAALRLVEAMSVEPNNELNVALLSNLGMIYFYNEQDSMALVVLDKAIERSPRLIAPREGRARILLNKGFDKDAYDEYANILEIDSTNVEARFIHGMMSLYAGNLPVALDDIKMLEKLVPTNTKTLLAKATLYSMTGKELEAISLFRNLIESDPAPEYFARLAACQLAIDRLGEASETIGTALDKYPTDAELFYYRAILNKKRYLLDDAQKDARRAIELGADKRKVLKIFEEPGASDNG